MRVLIAALAASIILAVFAALTASTPTNSTVQRGGHAVTVYTHGDLSQVPGVLSYDGGVTG